MWHKALAGTFRYEVTSNFRAPIIVWFRSQNMIRDEVKLCSTSNEVVGKARSSQEGHVAVRYNLTQQRRPFLRSWHRGSARSTVPFVQSCWNFGDVPSFCAFAPIASSSSKLPVAAAYSRGAVIRRRRRHKPHAVRREFSNVHHIWCCLSSGRPS